MSIKLAIGCNCYLFGEGLKKLLDEEKEIKVIGVFNEGVDLKEIVKIKSDVVLLDFNIFHDLPEDFSDDSKLKILLIAEKKVSSVSDTRIADLISKGVVGILPSGSDSYLLKKAIKAVYSGELWLDRKTMSTYLSFKGLSKKGKAPLTKSERGVAALICQGYRNKEIAQRRNISEQTVKSHCNRIFKKIGVSDRLQLAIYVYKLWPEWYHESMDKS